jgi:glycosyltransferase involved in cell wall biosynthesis
MKSADMLFLPSAEGMRLDYHLPGKLYEYLAVRRPILATGAVDGAMAAVLKDVGGAVMLDYRDEQGLADAVLQLARHRVFPTPVVVTSRLEQYERRNLSGRLARVLDRVTAGRNR